ncbi:hypothetical protein [Bradyrhizobium sp. CB1015]|uniref:hypothetical protein n=1 Tax=Bradyrhizobium sp. CB1015 TaxID=2976822 RepID=UPI0021AAE2A2|nr:hypothetical protein [Bradyrhizobium sp. CB1015]UWU89106.1 hypothetical protein N2604_21575 [Bradyrhizobium sp. CB1015]
MSAGKIIGQLLLGIASIIVSHAFLIAVHDVGWFPDQQLAKALMASPELLQVDWFRWAMTAALAIAIWGVADYFLYRRHLVAGNSKPKVERKDEVSPTHAITQYLPSTAPAVLLKDGWVLNFNPAVLTGRKLISFNSDGKIGEGRNKNEWTWSMVGDELEIRRQNGDLQNRFRFDPHSTKFISTNHPDAKGIRDQFIFRDRADQRS